MKSYNLIVLILISLSASLSCSLVDKKPLDIHEANDYISFSVPTISIDVVPFTKSEDVAIRSGSLKKDDSFGVLGYCLAYQPGTTTIDTNSGTAKYDDKKAVCPPDVFYKQSIVVGNSGCSYDIDNSTEGNQYKAWYPTTTYPNADDFEYTFYAYYPDTGFDITPANATTAGAPVMSYSLPYTSTTTETELDYKATPDAMIAGKKNHRKGDGHVKLTFNHIMASWSFQINNYSKIGTGADEDTEGQDLYIKSVKLSGTFKKTVNVDLTGNQVSWTFGEDTYSGTYPLFAAEDQNNGHKVSWKEDEGNNLYTLPAQLLLLSQPPVGQATITVVYKFGDDLEWQTEKATINQGFTPSPGVNHIMQLNWIGEALVLLIHAGGEETWEDGGADNNGDIIFD